MNVIELFGFRCEFYIVSDSSSCLKWIELMTIACQSGIEI